MVADRDAGFVPPPYPYDRLRALERVADALPGGVVDCSVGTPCDPVPEVASRAAADALDQSMGYPASAGSPALRSAAAAWIGRRFGVQLDASCVAACVGTKELVASLPHLLRLRNPRRDTVLYPAISYPPMRWARCSPDVAQCPCRSTTVGTSTSTRWPPTTPSARCCCGSTSRATRPRPRQRARSSRRLRRGDGRGASSSRATSATRSSRRSRRPSSPRASRAFWRSTACRSAPTSPGCGRVSTRATASSSTTSSRRASTPG